MVWDDGGSKVSCFVATTQMEGGILGFQETGNYESSLFWGLITPPPTLPQTQIWSVPIFTQSFILNLIYGPFGAGEFLPYISLTSIQLMWGFRTILGEMFWWWWPREFLPYEGKSSSWWIQPIWKICSSKWESSPNRGESKRYLKPPPIVMVFVRYNMGQKNTPKKKW